MGLDCSEIPVLCRKATTLRKKLAVTKATVM